MKQLVLITRERVGFFSQVEIIEISSSSQRFRKRNCFVQVREGCGKVSFLNLEAFFVNAGIVYTLSSYTVIVRHIRVNLAAASPK